MWSASVCSGGTPGGGLSCFTSAANDVTSVGVSGTYGLIPSSRPMAPNFPMSASDRPPIPPPGVYAP